MAIALVNCDRDVGVVVDRRVPCFRDPVNLSPPPCCEREAGKKPSALLLANLGSLASAAGSRPRTAVNSGGCCQSDGVGSLKSCQTMKEAYAVRRTVPPSAEIQAEIDKLLGSGLVDDPQKMLSELARLGARLIIQRAVEEEFDTLVGSRSL